MIKTIIIAIVLLISSSVSPGVLQAQSTRNKIAQQSQNDRLIDAFDLVSAAYRGYFQEWGIPGYARLDQAYRGGQITASDLIKAAIAANRLSATAIEDPSYIHAVDTNLYDLVTR